MASMLSAGQGARPGTASLENPQKTHRWLGPAPRPRALPLTEVPGDPLRGRVFGLTRYVAPVNPFGQMIGRLYDSPVVRLAPWAGHLLHR